MEVKYVEDPRINEEVVKVIEELKEEIVSRFHPKSIILTGSFGKGEVVAMERNAKVEFLSDCEVILIPYKWIFNRRKLDRFQQCFYEKTGLKVEIWGFTPTLYLSFPFMNKKIKPTIANYDLKYGSRVIYGKNYLEKIPNFKPVDIPLWEGIRLLSNRMAEALEYFSPQNPSKEMLFWADKIALACQDALLLSIGEYTPSYKVRNKIFVDSVNRFNVSCIRTLAEMATEATNRKLNPISENVSLGEVERYWFQVGKVCDEVFRHIVKAGYNLEFKDYLEFQEKYMSTGFRHYTTLPFDNVISQNFFRFLKKRMVGHKLPTLKMLLKPHIHWDHLIYSLIPLIYFGLGEDYIVNAKYLKRVVNTLSLFGEKVEGDDYSFEDWNHAKDVLLSCWYQMRL